MSISAIAPVASGPFEASQAKKKEELGQDDFLKLMITQFQNQDPFKPMENGEFLGQMAQFSTVSGLQELNQRFDALASAVGGSEGLGATQLIGRDAFFDQDQVRLAGDGTGVTGAIQTDGPGTVRIDVKDAAGQVLRSLSLQVPGNGQHRFEWDGLDATGQPVVAGEYRLSASVVSANSEYALPVMLAGRIEGVSLGGARGASLNVSGLGSLDLAAVREVF